MLDFYQQHFMLEINMVMNLKKKLLCKKNYFKPRAIYPTTLYREREQDFCLKKKKAKTFAPTNVNPTRKIITHKNFQENKPKEEEERIKEMTVCELKEVQ